jgi:3-oxoacyl-[acyl-carrier protein] reductase
MGGIDILICNAGVTKDNLMLRMSEQDFMEVLNVNLTSNFILIKAAIRGMMKKRAGRIITVGSIVGTTGNPGQANYVSSKAGLVGLTKTIAAEIASRGITANCIAPGFITTPMTQALNTKQTDEIAKMIPAQRFGTSEEVAAGVVYLASEEAGYITGQTLHINGGMAMV